MSHLSAFSCQHPPAHQHTRILSKFVILKHKKCESCKLQSVEFSNVKVWDIKVRTCETSKCESWKLHSSKIWNIKLRQLLISYFETWIFKAWDFTCGNINVWKLETSNFESLGQLRTLKHKSWTVRNFKVWNIKVGKLETPRAWDFQPPYFGAMASFF